MTLIETAKTKFIELSILPLLLAIGWTVFLYFAPCEKTSITTILIFPFLCFPCCFLSAAVTTWFMQSAGKLKIILCLSACFVLAVCVYVVCVVIAYTHYFAC